MTSLLEQLADLPKAEADALIRAMAPGEANAFEYDWRYRARPEQLPPAGSWRVWLLLAGRGFGKTRCGAEWVRAEVKAGRRRIALVGALAGSETNSQNSLRNEMPIRLPPFSCNQNNFTQF